VAIKGKIDNHEKEEYLTYCDDDNDIVWVKIVFGSLTLI
jgi:hypothetical protein